MHALARGAVAAGLAYALSVALRTTGDLKWPHDQDLYRDAAQATAFRDGHFLTDPLYCGETRWYNPLVPGVVGATARLTGRDPLLLYTRAGPALNLAAPMAFFVLTRALGGVGVAAVATLHFLFLKDPAVASWSAATYSPWLFPRNFAQAPFYLALLALLRSWQHRRPRDFVIAGALLGITFLAHTAPALVLGVLALAGFVRRPARPGAFAGLVLLLVTALLVSLPFLVPIAARYKLVVKNPAPMEFNVEPYPHPVPAEVWIGTVVAALAAVSLLRPARRRASAFLLLGWAGACLLLFAACRTEDLLRARGVFAPAVVPEFHFMFLLHGAESALFGWGLCRAGAALAHFLGRRATTAPALALLGVLLLRPLGAYPARDDLGGARSHALRLLHVHRLDRLDLFGRDSWQVIREHLQANARPRDVVLANAKNSLFIVGPTGRCVVAVADALANPYADQAKRKRAQGRMMAQLREGDGPGFRALATPLGVRWVLTDATEPVQPSAGLVLEAQAGEQTLWRVD